MSSSDVQKFKDIIIKLAKSVWDENKYTRRYAGTVIWVSDNGKRANVVLAIDSANALSNLLNKTSEVLSIGDQVYVDAINDNLSNCIIAVRKGEAIPLGGEGTGGDVTSVFGRIGVVSATPGDYTASQITNVASGNISSTDVQSAINELDSDISGLTKIWVQDSQPTSATPDDLWVDTDDYSRYDVLSLSDTRTLSVSDEEVITASGTFSITLHSASSAGIIKKIYNIGTGIITLVGTINGSSNMYLYPNESIELVSNGTDWRY